jgi:hypothetical protein
VSLPRMSSPAEGGSAPPAKRGPSLTLLALIAALGICLILMFVLVALIGPEFRRAESVRRTWRCQENLRILSRGMMAYTSRYDGVMPPVLKIDALPQRRRAYPYRCPESRKPYEFNQEMAGVNIHKIKNPEKTVWAYENLPSPHKGKASVAFANGTIGQIERREDAIWKPQFR